MLSVVYVILSFSLLSIHLDHLGRLGLDSTGVSGFTGRNAIDRVVLGDRLRLDRRVF